MMSKKTDLLPDQFGTHHTLKGQKDRRDPTAREHRDGEIEDEGTMLSLDKRFTPLSSRCCDLFPRDPLVENFRC